jgi:subtilisin family serine protease
VAAQGVGVKVAAPNSTTGYLSANGTSFSCPLTAGVVALLLQANPQASVDQVFQALRSTATQAGRPDNLLGYGVVDALAALRVLAPARLP